MKLCVSIIHQRAVATPTFAPIKSLQVTYVKQCKEGELIEIVREERDGVFFVDGRVNGEVRVQFRVDLNDLPVYKDIFICKYICV